MAAGAASKKGERTKWGLFFVCMSACAKQKYELRKQGKLGQHGEGGRRGG